MATQASLNEFKETFDILLRDILDDTQVSQELPNVIKRLEKNLRSNVPFDFEYRGYPLATSFVELCTGNVTPDQVRLSYILGWCWQLYMAFTTVLDDIVDDEKTRYGEPTWYYLHGKNLIAMNDGVLLEQVMYQVLLKHFGQLPCYNELHNYFRKAVYHYYLGHSFELLMRAESDPESFTMEKYRMYVKYQVNVPFLALFELPMILASRKDKELAQKVEQICMKISYLFRVRNDFNDSFGEHAKNDSDIIQGACTWLVLKAKDVCSSKEWKALKAAYGKGSSDDATNVTTVKSIYRKLAIPELLWLELDTVAADTRGDIEELRQLGEDVSNSLQRFVDVAVNNIS